jgi:alkanesulfonate monooxygenase SsuD/methylene tetrahydromethanopterin reductase-like flavin-dependent oxidoreductase (luciferase family)
MHFGGAMFSRIIRCRRQISPALEERGFPGGGDLPKQYYDAMDPFVVLAAASQVTKTIKLGTGVLLVRQRDAIQTAKLVASIDQGNL